MLINDDRVKENKGMRNLILLLACQNGLDISLANLLFALFKPGQLYSGVNKI